MTEPRSLIEVVKEKTFKQLSVNLGIIFFGFALVIVLAATHSLIGLWICLCGALAGLSFGVNLFAWLLKAETCFNEEETKND